MTTARANFTIACAASVFDVSPRTVARWCRKSMIGHCRLPAAPDAKIPGEVRFMASHLLNFIRVYALPDIYRERVEALVELARELEAADVTA